MIHCCHEHVELAIDIIVDEYETAPKIDKLPNNQLSTTCKFCRNQAIYVVSN